jgi:hypothetical protein
VGYCMICLCCLSSSILCILRFGCIFSLIHLQSGTIVCYYFSGCLYFSVFGSIPRKVTSGLDCSCVVFFFFAVYSMFGSESNIHGKEEGGRIGRNQVFSGVSLSR